MAAGAAGLKVAIEGSEFLDEHEVPALLMSLLKELAEKQPTDPLRHLAESILRVATEKGDEPPSKKRCITGKSDTDISIQNALPHACHFPFERTALVMIDLQKDFLDPKGFGACLGNDVSPCNTIVPACEAVLVAWRKRLGLIVHTLEAHVPDLSDCPGTKLDGPRAPPAGKRIGDVLSPEMGRILVRGEPGNGLVSRLEAVPGEKVIHKPGKGAFYNTDLDSYLQASGVTHLIFTGVTTEVCVQTSMREANDRGYECLLLEDCTASYFADFKQGTLEQVRAQGGIVGWTAKSSELLAALPPV